MSTPAFLSLLWTGVLLVGGVLLLRIARGRALHDPGHPDSPPGRWNR